MAVNFCGSRVADRADNADPTCLRASPAEAWPLSM